MFGPRWGALRNQVHHVVVTERDPAGNREAQPARDAPKEPAPTDSRADSTADRSIAAGAPAASPRRQAPLRRA